MKSSASELGLTCVISKLYPCIKNYHLRSNAFLQIAFIDNASKVGDLAKKFGFQKEDAITLKHNRCCMFSCFER